MKNWFTNVLSGFSALIISMISYLFLQDLRVEKVQTDMSKAEESLKKKQWIHDMLRDPLTDSIPANYFWMDRTFLADYLQETSHGNSLNKRNATWHNRGPFNVGGRSRTIVVDMNDENHLLTGAVSGGIWESIDAGVSWQRVTLPNDHPGCVSICQDTRPGYQHIWYALSGELYGTSASGGSAFYLGDGAFRSLDNGHTWFPLKSTAGGFPNQFTSSLQGGWRIVASPVDTVQACVYMACYGSIYRSTDTGNTWKLILGGVNNTSYFTDVAVSSTGIVYACLSSDGVTKGIFRSHDGVNFTNITPTFLKSYDRIVIEINPNNENEVYFLAALPSDTSGGVATSDYEGTPEYVGLFKYTYISGSGANTLGNWINLSANLPVDNAGPFDKFNTQGGYDIMIKVQPQSNTIIIGGTNLYRSTDGFTSKNNTQQIGGYALATTLPNFTVYPNHHPDQHDVWFLKSNPNIMYSATDGGIFRTNNLLATQVVWDDLNHGYQTTQFYTIQIDPYQAFDQLLLGGLQDNGNYITATNQLQTSWRMTINGDGAHNYIAPGKKWGIISTQLGNTRLVKFDAYGNVVQQKRIDPAEINKNQYNFINHLVVNPSNRNTLLMPIGKKIARLRNLNSIPINNDLNKLSGKWEYSDSISTGNIGNRPANITAIAISSTSNKLYVGTNNRDIFVIENTEAENLVLKKCNIERLPNGGYVSQICIDPENENHVLVCYSNYNIKSIFYTDDGGDNWYYVGGNLEGTQNSSGANPSIRSLGILVHPDGHRTYFAGTSVGLFSTESLILSVNNAGDSTRWKQESPNIIGAAIVTDIKVRQSDGYVVAATHGNGVYESFYTGLPRPLSTNIIHSLSLYPNPASDYLNVSMNVTEQSNLFVYLSDIMG
jgi:hypothetical protein